MEARQQVTAEMDEGWKRPFKSKPKSCWQSPRLLCQELIIDCNVSLEDVGIPIGHQQG
jgi:hypothetical protein